ncbi:MAG TPA: methyl-accepting chemotaxis protein, partial [Accumulibacter sp.]|nr:methyl-accepting chemotaxis protein [Accumulibacter sp.]
VAGIGQMARQLRDLVFSLNQAVTQVNDASRSLTRNVEASANAASDVRDSTRSIAAAIEELSVGINRIARTAKTGAQIAEKSEDQSGRGGQIIEKAATEIRSIAEMIGGVSTRIAALGKSSERISGVVQVIRDVAEQTNLLALNAAIEAARAGESGRGFAVVADEVRKLAERTGAATGDIATMITAIQESSHDAVEAMEQAVARVGSSVGYSDEAAQAIVEIRDSAGQSVTIVKEIDGALVEQSTTSQTISTEIERVALSTETGHSAVQLAAQSARELEALAASLRKTVNHFRV